MKSDAHPHAANVSALVAKDPRLAHVVAHVGPCGLGLREAPAAEKKDYFHGLVRAIVSQQLSGKAAETIFGRVRALAPTFDPTSILALPEERLREAGLSGAKARYVRGLAEAAASGSVRLHLLETMSDDEVLEELCRLKGIGRWTAEMILMFQLGRLDVLPVDDLGIQKGMIRLFNMRKPPTKERMAALAKPWRPYRSIACWYLWRLTELSDEGLRELRAKAKING